MQEQDVKNTDITKSRQTECLLLFVLVAAVGLICFALHGAWPFGTLVLEGDDGYRQHIPELYYIWDLLHGKRSFFFDWDLSFGVNPVGSFLHFGMLSPLNLLYLFIPRSAVLYSVNIMVLLRLQLLAFSFRFFLRRMCNEKMPEVFVVILSLCYAFNSFTIHYLYFSQWIDTAIILPLLVYAAVRLMKEGKAAAYVLLLALALILCIQQDYMLVLFFGFFAGIFLMFFELTDHEKGKAALRLAIYSIIAGMIAAVILLPAAFQVMESSRMEGNLMFLIKQILRSNAAPDHSYDKEKFLLAASPLVYTTAAVMLLVIKAAGRQKPAKAVIGLILMSLIHLLPCFIESIHYFWQGGVYLCFPHRNGYMMCFSALFLLAFLLDDLKLPEKVNSKYAKTAVLVLITLIAVLLTHDRMKTAELGYGKDKEKLYASENALFEQMGGSRSDERFMDKDKGFELNYPLVADVASAENWVHIIPASVLNECDALGYYHAGSAVYSKGGTIVSDAMLGTKYVMMAHGGDKSLYRAVDGAEEQGVYECLYTWPFGFFIDGYSDTENKYAAELQNDIIRRSSGAAGFSLKAAAAGETVEFEFDKETLLYFDNRIFADSAIGFLDSEFEIYPARINYIGIFMGKAEFTPRTEGMFMSIALDALEALKPADRFISREFSHNGMNCRIRHEGGNKILFLPVNNIPGWECRLNGKKTETISVYGGFMAVPFPDEAGEYELEIKYHPPLFAPGVVLFFIGMGSLFISLKYRVTEKLADVSWICRMAEITLMLICTAAFMLIYAADIALTLIPSGLWWNLLAPK